MRREESDVVNARILRWADALPEDRLTAPEFAAVLGVSTSELRRRMRNLGVSCGRSNE